MESKSLKNKKSTRNKGIFLVIISTLIIAVAQFFLKKGANLATTNITSYLNIWVIIGILLYGFATLIFVVGLKYGKLSTLYPLLGLGYVWVSLISYFVFRELLTSLDILGISLIVLGVALLGGFDNG